MRLFDIAPGNFFSVLSSGNRETYFDALMILHNMFKYELNIRVDEYLSALISMLEDRVFEMEDEDDAVEAGNTLSSKARVILNRLLRAGWVDKEFMDASFVEIITPRSYAIPIMMTLSELGDNSIKEYNSLVFSTFSSLRQAMNDGGAHMYEAVLSARANTEQLQYSLRALYHSIREFLRGIVEQHDVNILLREHFQEYKALSDQVYHPIKTMDSIHRYMGPIQGLLSDILANGALLQAARERAMGVRNYEHESLADEEITRSIDFVMDFYHTVGGLVSEIDRKHSNYTKSSIEKIQYIMTADQSIKGSLTEILKAYANNDGPERERVARMMDRHILTNKQEFLDSGSLYHRSARSRRSDKTPLPVEFDAALSESARRIIQKHIQSGYPLSKIRSYVEGLLASNAGEVASADIPIENDEDFVLLILAVVRQNERGMTHVVEYYDGQTRRGAYTIPNMLIRGKAVGGFVG